MAGPRDDGTFAENQAHHPNRKVSRGAVMGPAAARNLSLSGYIDNYGGSHVIKNLARLYNLTPDEAMSVMDAHRNEYDLDDAGYEGFTRENDSVIARLGTTNPTEALTESIRERRRPAGSLDSTSRIDPEPRPYWNGVPH